MLAHALSQSGPAATLLGQCGLRVVVLRAHPRQILSHGARCAGLKDPQPIGDSDKALVLDVLAVLFDEVDEDMIKEVMDSKAARVYVG